MNCQTTPHSITSCPNDNYHGCLVSYVGLIGSDVTPNYVDASHTNITISPWCGCRGSGNHEAECEAFLRDFRENTCLRNAIQAFGYGTDAGLVPITESQSAVPSVQTNLQPAIITKHVINSNDVKQIDRKGALRDPRHQRRELPDPRSGRGTAPVYTAVGPGCRGRPSPASAAASEEDEAAEEPRPSRPGPKRERVRAADSALTWTLPP
ncbi:hypothetical protein cypCar_00031445 [Cyprinus carpio]|nr:hypothetical protein cypCar_00031445 [Cyprinus carpio]